MNRKSIALILIILSATILATCGDSVLTETTTDYWLVERDELYERGLVFDYIFSIDAPHHQNAYYVRYVGDNDKLIGTYVNGEYRAYPYFILSHHETVNDYIDDFNYTVIYCPFTALGTVWSRADFDDSTKFSLVDLVYNNSHIVFDWISDTYWLPMKQQCIHGSLAGQDSPRMRSVETVWSTWEEMYPESEVLSNRTGYDDDYETDPYPQYSSDHNLIYYPITLLDSRLNNKDRVHAIIDGDFARAYPVDSFPDSVIVLNDTFNDVPIVIAGSDAKKLIISYSRQLTDGTILTFEAVQDSLPVILTDSEGNTWDVFGTAVSGPRTGTSLPMILSYNCYWYAVVALYPAIELIEL